MTFESCSFRSFIPDCQAPAPKRRKVSQTAESRFIPLRPFGIGAYSIDSPEAKIPTIYQQVLSSTMLGSCNPGGERVLHYTAEPSSPRFSIPLQEPLHPQLSLFRVLDIPDFSQDSNQQPLAYNPATDCLGVILGSDVHLQNKRIRGKHLAFNDANPPKAIAFSLQGNELLLRLKNGLFLRYNLKFTPNELKVEKTAEIDLGEETLPLLSWNSCSFLGTVDGRIRRIDNIKPLESTYYIGSSREPIERLASYPRSNLLLAGSRSGTIDLFDVDEKKPLSTFQAFPGIPITALAFSSCGSYFVACGGEKMVLCAIDKKIKKLAEHPLESPATTIFWRDELVVSTHTNGQACTFRIKLDNQTPIGEPKSHPINMNGYPITHAIFKGESDCNILLAACADTETLSFLEFNRFGKKPECMFPRPKPLNIYSEIR